MRGINEIISFGRVGRGRGCDCSYGHGRHGRDGRRYGQGPEHGLLGIIVRRNSIMVKCNDVNQMELHPSYQFTDSQWGILPEAENKRIINECAQYKRSRQGGYHNNVVR